MKKLLAIFLVVSVLFSLASCGGNETESNINNNDVVENDDNNQQNIENNDVADNKQDIPDDLTADFVKSYPVTDASQFEVSETPDGIAISNYIGSDAIVVIPEQINGKAVTVIDIRAFAQQSSLRAIKLANSIKEIKSEAFFNCSNLEIIVCGTSLEIVEDYGFAAGTALKFVELNDGLKELGFLAISGDLLTEIYVPASVEKIGDGAFPIRDDFKIICEAGSYAETFAKENNFIYEIR